MQLELRAEKQHCDIVQLQETVPFVDAGSPERDREREAQDELGQRWPRNGADNGIRSFKEPANFLPFAAAADAVRQSSSGLLIGRGESTCLEHSGDVGREIECRTVRERSRGGRAERFARDEASQKDRAAGGSRRTITSRPGLVASASSGSVAAIRPTGPSLRFAAKMVTAGA